MCGIALWLSQPSESAPNTTQKSKYDIITHQEELKKSLLRRGPDSFKELKIEVNTNTGESQSNSDGSKTPLLIHFISTVLHLRGTEMQVTVQPIIDEKSKDILAWNGEIFDGIKIPIGENDGYHLLQHLVKFTNPINSTNTPLSASEVQRAVSHAVSFLKGPWSFVYYHFNTNQLFFGRDFFGRRSLLWHLDPNNPSEFMLSSIATAYTVEIDSFSKSSGEDEDESSSSTSTGNSSNNNSTGFWTEVPAKGIYSLQLHLPLQEPVCHPWSIVPNSEREMYLSGSFSSFFNPPFSFLGSLNQQLPSEEEDIALKSVALALTSNASTGFTASKESLKTSTMAKLCNVLSESVRRRVQALPLISSSSSSSSSFSIKSSRIAILFSGGIDSMIIAALAHAHVPPNETIDLINVAFENKARTKATSNASDAIYNVPDRITGRAGWKELTQAVANNTILDTLQWATSLTNSSSVDEGTSSSSSTQQPPESTASQFQRYRLVEVNVSRTEYDNAILHVASCMQPLETVMDLSIAAALWFAARGQGHIYNPAESSSSPVLYTSTSPVILVGMGADEQFAGYGRHRSKFEVAGWPGLLSEITLDTSRISSRNLGRDDRCISDHGKESRLPFLDEDVVAYLNSLPVHEKTNMYLPRGRGEKSLLRGLGYLFGLESASLLAKRAIQFGARTAKMDPGGGLRGQHKLLFVTQ